MPTLKLEHSNEELHQILVKRSKDRQREEYIAMLHKRQYPLPVELLKIVVWYLPGYCLDWLPSGECIIRCDLPTQHFLQPYVPSYVPSYVYEEYEEDEYAEYEEMYNPDYD
jgi:hypothetical protein